MMWYGRSPMAPKIFFFLLILPSFLFTGFYRTSSAATAETKPSRENAPYSERSAEALPERITMKQALDMLKRKSRRTEATKSRVDIAAADRITARAYPNPTFEYSGLALALGATLDAVWEHQFILEQPILLFGQRGARKQLADANVLATQAQVALDLKKRTRAVRKAFVTLLAHQKRLELLKRSSQDLDRILKIVRGRSSAGDQSLYEVARIELEIETHRLEIERTRTDLEDASGKLSALLGMPGYRPSAEGNLSPVSIPSNKTELWQKASANHPAIMAAQAHRSVAESKLRVARRERLPTPSFVMGINQTQDERSTSVVFGFSIPLPIFDRGKGDIARANATIKAESKALEAEQLEIRAEINRAHSVYIRQLATLQRMEEKMLKRLPELRRMAEKSYSETGSSFLDLLDAFRTIKNLELLYLKQREAVKKAEVTLISAAALELVFRAR